MYHGCKVTKKRAQNHLSQKKVAKTFGGFKECPYLCNRKSEMTRTLRNLTPLFVYVHVVHTETSPSCIRLSYASLSAQFTIFKPGMFLKCLTFSVTKIN